MPLPNTNTNTSTVKMSDQKNKTTPVLGYWNIRGLAQPTRLLLKYLGVEYEDQRYFHGQPPDYNCQEWLTVKFTLGLDLPNLPYWIDDNVKITESKAVFRYIARAYGPDLVPPTSELKSKSDMIEGFLKDLQSVLIQVAYSRNDPEIPIETALTQRFEQLSTFIGDNNWALGSKLLYLDFYLYEVLFEFQKYNPDFLKPYPNLAKYVDNFEAIPELVEYIKETDSLTCYSPSAIKVF